MKPHRSEQVSRSLLVACLLAVLWLTLFKFSVHPASVFKVHTRSLNLVPFAASTRSDVTEMAENFLAFVPLGLLLSVNSKRSSFWQRLACLCLLSVAIELTQFVFAIGVSDITDVITNTLGAFAGLGAYALVRRAFGEESTDNAVHVVAIAFLVLFLALVAFALAHHVRFDHRHQQ